MTVQATNQISESTLLRRVLRANALFSGVSGLVLTVGATQVAALIGLSNPITLLVLGIALVIFGVGLFQLSAQKSLIRQVAVATIILDALWLLGSAAILFTDLVALTPVGFWAVAIVADIVAVLAILQFIALRRL